MDSYLLDSCIRHAQEDRPLHVRAGVAAKQLLDTARKLLALLSLGARENGLRCFPEVPDTGCDCIQLSLRESTI